MTRNLDRAETFPIEHCIHHPIFRVNLKLSFEFGISIFMPVVT